MIATPEDIQTARAFLSSAIDEHELRRELAAVSDEAIIEALKMELRAARRERDQHAQDLREAQLYITQIQNRLTIAREALSREQAKVREIVGAVG
ncbi:MAG: hypothetical protein M0Z43_04490 [Acidithiobacillus sp.]|nr:hypothetical protein [Acidithiobacillus sp.]